MTKVKHHGLIVIREEAPEALKGIDGEAIAVAADDPWTFSVHAYADGGAVFEQNLKSVRLGRKGRSGRRIVHMGKNPLYFGAEGEAVACFAGPQSLGDFV
ncbi:MAG: hypothetical protein V4477_07600 [Pseudomonadota bacterium]